MLHKRGLISLLVLGALLLTAACQPITTQSEPMAPPSDEDVVAAVNEIWREYETTQMTSDTDGWIALWTDDGVKMPPNGPAVEGRDAIYARVQRGMTNAPTDEMVITALETQSAGEWAYSRGTFTVTYTIADTGVQELMDGKFMTILQRQPDGTWKIHRDIHNSNVPPAAPAAAEEVDVEAVTEAVTAFWAEYEASVEAGDADRWGELWVDDGVKYPPDGPMLEGKEAIVNNMHEWMAMAIANEATITNHTVEVAGDFAFVRGLFRVDAELKANGMPVVMDGKYMSILQRQADGTWKLYRDIFNSNVPPAAPAAAEEIDIEAVTASILTTWDEYVASTLTNDVDRRLALWADDGVILRPGKAPVEGKDAIYERVNGSFSRMTYEDMTIDNVEVEVSGDMAFARGTYTVQAIVDETGEPSYTDGTYMSIFKRQADGTWKLYRDMTHSNIPPTPPTDVNEVAAAVDAIWREYEASLLAGDADRWIGLWAEDGVQLPPGAPAVNGKEAIYAGIVSDLDMYEYTEFVIVPEELSVNGDMAISRGVYTVTFVAKTEGEPISFEGKYMTFISQQEDGTWKIYRDIFNSNVP